MDLIQHYLCVQHGGSPACEKLAKEFGFVCPKCYAQLQAEVDTAKETYDQLFLDFVNRGAGIRELHDKVELLKDLRRWIPVEERLPEDERKVLVSDGHSCWTDHYNSKGEWKNIIPGGGDNVIYTHWKPIILPDQEKKG